MNSINNKNIKNIFLLFFLIFPVFFSLDGGIYKGITEAEKNYMNLPLPISTFFISVYLIIIFKKNNLKDLIKNKLINTAIFVFIILLIVNFINYSDNKIVLLIQFAIPWAGLFIGNYLTLDKNFNKTYLFLIFFIFFHIFFTIIKGKYILIENLFFFSIYQNIQYVVVTVILISILCSINFVKKNFKKVLILNVLTFMYSLMSYSFSAIIFQLIFILYLSFSFFNDPKIENKKFLLTFFTIFLLICFSFFLIKYSKDEYQDRFITDKNYHENVKKFIDIIKLKMPQNISLRFEIWKSYINYLKNNPKVIFVGDINFSLDKKYNSAHNLLIDIIYKFGLILLIPYFLLIYFTLKKIKNEKNYEKKLSLFFLIFILIVENFIKLSLKQPYSGFIMMYYLGYFLRK